MGPIRMRPSRVLEKLRKGQVATCMKINLADSRVIEIAALAGFDSLWTDMEHVPNDWSAIEKQALAAKAHQVDLVVRVARGSYSDLIRPLEMDAAAIMVPHVMSLEDARAVVRQTKFYPLGLRALDGGNADGSYCGIDTLTYMKTANRERFNILQIEDPEPLEQLEEIMSLPGLDMIFFGPADFSQAIGLPGQTRHQKVDDARIRIADMARKKGKFAGTVGRVDNFAELIAMGYQWISVGADVAGLSRYCRDIVAQLAPKPDGEDEQAGAGPGLYDGGARTGRSG
ncbi:HpcH/HpaI aldolase family protein [Paenibacillus cymbidii]|uniref:HpcH/HpaI aldolase family protein n=1 Tax=Paenibacillus cymbidii TaxID=1639034 RepID=UPI001F214967|nr:aldolase/citrate lyase family protein [Paenibacillus cymbidii]